jgi:hypothetical protein
MNKKILVGIAITVIVIAVVVGLKTIMGDKALALPGEEHTENALNLSETSKTTSNSTEPAKSVSTESGESGP